MGYVFPCANTAVGYDGGVIMLRQEDIWDADDPFVLAHPEMFSSHPTRGVVKHTTAAVEQMTAAPGERRGPGRPRRV